MIDLKKEYDYYRGFEGYDQIQILMCNRTESLTKLIIWVGYFNEIIECIETIDGEWKGVPLHYHEDSGWYDVNYWKCENLELFLEQLRKINISIFEFDESSLILEVLKQIIEKSIISGYNVYFHLN